MVTNQIIQSSNGTNHQHRYNFKCNRPKKYTPVVSDLVEISSGEYDCIGITDTLSKIESYTNIVDHIINIFQLDYYCDMMDLDMKIIQD